MFVTPPSVNNLYALFFVLFSNIFLCVKDGRVPFCYYSLYIILLLCILSCYYFILLLSLKLKGIYQMGDISSLILLRKIVRLYPTIYLTTNSVACLRLSLKYVHIFFQRCLIHNILLTIRCPIRNIIKFYFS